MNPDPNRESNREDGLKRRLANLRPFEPGNRANPNGKAGKHSLKYEDVHAKLIAELGGGALSPIEDVLIDRLASLLVRRPKNDADAVKLAGASLRIIRQLQADRDRRQQRRDGYVPLRERA